MKNILVFGAGQSTPYLIHYLLKEAKKYDWLVTVCDRNLEAAQSRVNGHPNGTAVEFDVNDTNLRNTLISNSDVVVNMLAPAFQFPIALDCLKNSKHCITASYENSQTHDLHKDAMRNGILILNEMGLDPGIDHMSAMSIINKIRSKGGYVSSFVSYGSGIPAPEVKSNPLNYCITWNPRNVVMAGETGAQYLENGNLKILSHRHVFQRTWNVDVDGVGTLEAYPNRDSLIYKRLFKLKNVETMIRGTLRYPGWSETWLQVIRLGIPNEHIIVQNLHKMTYAQFTELFLPMNLSGTRLEARVANYLSINPTGAIMQNLRWLGLFSDEKIPGNPQTPAEVLIDLMKRKMPLPVGSRDMVVLVHRIEATYPERERKRQVVSSSLVEYGEPGGMTAIAKTVGLPAAVAAKLLLKGELPLTGCHIPTHPVIYSRVLKELKAEGITFVEKTKTFK